YARPRNAGLVIEKLKKALETANTNNPYSIFLNFCEVIPSKQIEDLALQLADYVILKCIQLDNRDGLSFSFDFDFDMSELNCFKDFISQIEINRIERESKEKKRYFSIMWSASKKAPEGWLDDEQATMTAIEKKTKRYSGSESDLVLLLEARNVPVDDYYIPLIKKSAKKREIKFKEIWVVNNFVGDKRAICIFSR
ncbi:hypothetical protein ACFL1E_04580, partial [Candidatus Omnitrophota bacterium]